MSTRALDDPELEERRLQALVQIRQFPDPVLKMPAAEVTVFDASLIAEIRFMGQIMVDGRGVGLAAPQIGRSRRVIVLRPDEDQPITALINPRITVASDETEIGDEGCLSIGEVNVPVARSVEIGVSAQDMEGSPFTFESQGFAARVIQHEIDHLDGVLMLDRTDTDERRRALRELRESGG